LVKGSAKRCFATPPMDRPSRPQRGLAELPVSVKLEVCQEPSEACAELICAVAAEGGHLVMTGGRTPRAAYETAAASGVDWSRATLWFGDERCVAPSDELSNYRLVKESLLDRLAGREPTVHRMQGELGPDAAADSYERELAAAGPPEFDLVLLGLGPDGHLASLFPSQASLSVRERLVIGVHKAGLEPFVPRVSMTLPILGSGKRVVFLVSGQSKAGAVAAAFGPDAKPDPRVPASMLPPFASEVTVLLDPAAATGVPSS
jgi:6-phosphogluconolactonase